ncbi:MAG: hypothetical protein AAF403_04135 [Pseudomonadota bacterium]
MVSFLSYFDYHIFLILALPFIGLLFLRFWRAKKKQRQDKFNRQRLDEDQDIDSYLARQRLKMAIATGGLLAFFIIAILKIFGFKPD